MMQAILEKFEFFPIKCRVQRALELFKETCKCKENIVDKFPLKQKVKTPIHHKGKRDSEFWEQSSCVLIKF